MKSKLQKCFKILTVGVLFVLSAQLLAQEVDNKDRDMGLLVQIKRTGTNFYVNSGNKKYELGDYAGAISAYTKAIEMEPNSKEAYFNRANAKNRNNPFGGANFNYQAWELKVLEAAKDYTKAIELDPSFADAYNNRSLMYIQVCSASEELKQSAEDDINRAIQINPNFAIAYYNRGYLGFLYCKKIDPRKEYATALQLDPSIAKFHDYIAQMESND
ncbi:MAG: tetratricopeptide repeat protein [bacterium]